MYRSYTVNTLSASLAAEHFLLAFSLKQGAHV